MLRGTRFNYRAFATAGTDLSDATDATTTDYETDSVEPERARLPRVGRPIDMLSADNPHAAKRIPEKYLAENYEHFSGNPMYEHQHTKGVEEDEWEDAMVDKFSMDDYNRWKKNLTKEKFETLKGMLAYEHK